MARPAVADAGTNGEASQTDAETNAEPDPPELDLLALRDGLPDVVDTPEALTAACADIAAGTGPVAIDAERASGYRYSSRAYLIQLRRHGSTTHLIDPTAFDDLAPLERALDANEWILHAASQDLACLREVGLEPTSLFDTELAARLLGHPRVGLAALVEALCGKRMRKEHSAADWSRRPLPTAWLDYAALDVEALVEIHDVLAQELVNAGKLEWAQQEFSHVMAQRSTPRVDPWRRTSGMHKARGRRSVAAVRELWLARDQIATRRDVTPGRVLPDSAIVVAAHALPTDRSGLLRLKGFHGRGAERYADNWVRAIRTARELPESELPPVAVRAEGPPPARSWPERNPEAAGRLAAARAALTVVSEEHAVPVENLLTPDVVRRVLWAPPAARERVELTAAVTARLTEMGARPWQVDLVGPVLRDAILNPRPPATVEPESPEPELSETETDSAS
ncbi:MAG: ribonuclease D [Marmoricola sp.]